MCTREVRALGAQDQAQGSGAGSGARSGAGSRAGREPGVRRSSPSQGQGVGGAGSNGEGLQCVGMAVPTRERIEQTPALMKTEAVVKSEETTSAAQERDHETRVADKAHQVGEEVERPSVEGDHLEEREYHRRDVPLQPVQASRQGGTSVPRPRDCEQCGVVTTPLSPSPPFHAFGRRHPSLWDNAAVAGGLTSQSRCPRAHRGSRGGRAAPSWCTGP